MERHRFNVCIERRDDNGIWSINSNDNFDTIIEARTVNDAERMLMSQYGHVETLWSVLTIAGRHNGSNSCAQMARRSYGLRAASTY